MSIIIPAINNHQKLEKFLKSSYEYGILMSFQLAQLPEAVKIFKENGRKVLIHSELIKGLSPDEYGAIYLIQTLGVDGIISSKPKVIEICKKRKKIGVFRFFLKDMVSLEQSLAIAKQLRPEFIEVLPAFGVEIVPYIAKQTNAKVMVGGLINSKKQIEDCFKKGVFGITLSNSDLW
ncbi:glycerol-3-phosphate responsive antiterminator [Acholeplasma sp. OttesenSCG-928-E16]|nr:glycerol-3-phosphate responsive antiterminator [Acholeplasma sp. OttesenSCG-928-E16]